MFYVFIQVEETGSIQVLQYDSQSFQWTTYCTSMLYVGNGGTVNNVCITCGNNQQLVCSVWSDTCLDEWGNSIYSLSYHIGKYTIHFNGDSQLVFILDFDNRLIELSNYNQIMCNCPLINLYPVHSGGVWFVAKSGHLSPVNLMVYWVSTDTCLQVICLACMHMCHLLYVSLIYGVKIAGAEGVINNGKTLKYCPEEQLVSGVK